MSAAIDLCIAEDDVFDGGVRHYTEETLIACCISSSALPMDANAANLVAITIEDLSWYGGD